MENSVRILLLYGDLLDLYGDGGNIAIIKRRLEEMGIFCAITECGADGVPDFEGADLIYSGPGKGRNLAHTARHFTSYADAFSGAVERGAVCLFTGNSKLMLGKSFTTLQGEEIAGAGLFDYTGRDTGKVFVSDITAYPLIPDCEGRIYGFINRTAHIEGADSHHLFKVEYGAGDGEGVAEFEGNLLNNLFATWCLGPLLVKNPHLLRALLMRLLGERFCDYDDSLERLALERTLCDMDAEKR